MLSDFLTLEVYFGAPNSALYFEDLVKRYGPKKTAKALHDGDLECHRCCTGYDMGRNLIWLSEQGRHKAESLIS